MRTFVGSALETTASAYDLADLVNTEASRVRIGDFEARLREQIDHQLLAATYGVKVVQVGIERLTLPKVTLSATVDRMRAERETIATRRTKPRGQIARPREIRSAAGATPGDQAEASVKPRRSGAQARVRSGAHLRQDLRRFAAAIQPALAGHPRHHRQRRYPAESRAPDAAPFRVLVDGPPASPLTPASRRRPQAAKRARAAQPLAAGRTPGVPHYSA